MEWHEVKQNITNNSRWATSNADVILLHAPGYPTLEKSFKHILTRCQNINLSISRHNITTDNKVRFAGTTSEQ